MSGGVGIGVPKPVSLALAVVDRLTTILSTPHTKADVENAKQAALESLNATRESVERHHALLNRFSDFLDGNSELLEIVEQRIEQRKQQDAKLNAAKNAQNAYKCGCF